MKTCPTNFTFLCTPAYDWSWEGVARGVATPGSRITDSKINTLNAKRDSIFCAQNTLNYLNQTVEIQ
jgi:hypothetical protein